MNEPVATRTDFPTFPEVALGYSPPGRDRRPGLTKGAGRATGRGMNRISGAIFILAGCICSATAAVLLGMAFGETGKLLAGVFMFIQSYVLISRGSKLHDRID